MLGWIAWAFRVELQRRLKAAANRVKFSSNPESLLGRFEQVTLARVLVSVLIRQLLDTTPADISQPQKISSSDSPPGL